MNGKNKLYLVDTNVIVRYLLGEQKNLGLEAYNFFEDVQAGKKRAVILESVFTETIFILSKVYSVKREDVFISLSGLLQYKGISIDDKEALVKSLEIYKNTKLHIVDCILISKVLINDINLMSFDNELNNILVSYKNQ